MLATPDQPTANGEHTPDDPRRSFKSDLSSQARMPRAAIPESVEGPGHPELSGQFGRLLRPDNCIHEITIPMRRENFRLRSGGRPITICEDRSLGEVGVGAPERGSYSDGKVCHTAKDDELDPPDEEWFGRGVQNVSILDLENGHIVRGASEERSVRRDRGARLD